MKLDFLESWLRELQSQCNILDLNLTEV